MQELASFLDPLLLASAVAALLVFGLMTALMQDRGEKRARSDIRKRLEIDRKHEAAARQDRPAPQQTARSAARQLSRKTNDFYASSDPANMRKIQMRLIQAGYLGENSLGMFLLARLLVGIGFAVLGLLAAFLMPDETGLANRLLVTISMATVGYFLPNFHLNRRIRRLQDENRRGFPDVMDLMIVAAEAGLTLEASIERIAREVEITYPTLSRQLALAALEIRAGRPLDQALRAFGERLGLDEVQGFATMIQQSKELGTSISDALRVYSEEMRHKRMMAAEERAYALPAKLSIPVTGFILPVVIGVAVLPTVVRMINQ